MLATKFCPIDLALEKSSQVVHQHSWFRRVKSPPFRHASQGTQNPAWYRPNHRNYYYVHCEGAKYGFCLPPSSTFRREILRAFGSMEYQVNMGRGLEAVKAFNLSKRHIFKLFFFIMYYYYSNTTSWVVYNLGKNLCI